MHNSTQQEIPGTPQVIQTIDEYFQKMQKDLYLIVFGDPPTVTFDFNRKTKSNPPGQSEILRWFRKNLPGVRVNPIWLHQMLPYDGTLSVEFDSESLSIYCAKWENELGKSLDPRFTCYLYPYSSYIKRMAQRESQ